MKKTIEHKDGAFKWFMKRVKVTSKTGRSIEGELTDWEKDKISIQLKKNEILPTFQIIEIDRKDISKIEVIEK